MRKNLPRLAVGVLAFLCAAATAAPVNRMILPDDVVPGAYRISITPHIAQTTFDGSVALDDQATAPRVALDPQRQRATFDLTVTVPADRMAIGNMPIAATEALPGNLKRVRFATTPKMSTYLLFFGLGDFERVHRDVAGVDVGVVVKRGDTAQAAYALDAAARILPYTTSGSARRIRCPSSTWWPVPAAASPSVRWRTGARSSTSSATC
jgi:hypothetical protein